MIEIPRLLRQRIAEDLRRALGVSVQVQLQPEGTFERSQLKSSRVIDKRGIWRVGGDAPGPTL